MADETLDYTIPFQLTKTIRRDPYDAISPTNPELSAAGKVIIITGGGTGLGAAAAEVWARAGAEGIVVAGRRLDKLQDTVLKVRAINNGKTKTLAVQTDLLKDADVANLFTETINTFGRSPDVVLSNAGVVAEAKIGQQSPDDWWEVMGINLKGVYSTAHYFIKTQPDPQNARGTFIATNSGLAGLVVPEVSAYTVSKLASQRLVEHLHAEYPTLRAFSLLPGVVKTPMLVNRFSKYGKDHADLTGMLALYLSSPRAEFLRGGITSVNWDVEETEAHKDEILRDRLLDLKWIPILPASGGKGFD